MPIKLTVHGGSPLLGEVILSGAKIDAPKLMVASLLTDEACIIENFPRMAETSITVELIESVGGKVTFQNGKAVLHTPTITNFRVKELTRRNRIPILAIAPLLHRIGKAEVPLLGGDLIGPRPVNFHIEALEKMGAKIEQKEKSYYAEAKKLRGTDFTLPYPSVGATETLLFAGVLAEGTTTIHGSAIEPGIQDLIYFLQKMGATIIPDLHSRTIVIKGVEKLKGASHAVLPDITEAVSFASIAYMTGGGIFVRHADASHLAAFLRALETIGARYQIERDGIHFFSSPQAPRPIKLETDVHPGFMTDWQPPFAVLLTKASGTSTIHETVYEDRFGYTKLLKDMGAHIEVSTSCLGSLPCRFAFRGHPHSAIIQGPTQLHAHDFTIPDIRAGVATVIAALTAKGDSHITGIEHIERGYENFFGKIEKLGAKIELV